MPTRKLIDWEAIERDYRLGQLTDTELARSHGVGRGSLLRKARRDGWKRDLSAQVRARTRAALIGNDSQGVVGVDPDSLDAAGVERAVKANVEIVESHRVLLHSGRDFATMILGELRQATEHREEIEAAIEEETAADKSPKRRTMMLKAVNVASRASAGNAVSTMIRNLIAGERRAYDLDEPGKGDGEGGGVEEGGTRIVIVPAKEGGSEPVVRAIEKPGA